MTIKQILLFMTATLGAAASLSAQFGGDPLETWERQYQNGIAAIVEGRIITREELRKKMSPIVPQIMRESRNAVEFEQRIQQLEREVLQNEIDKVLIVKAFNEIEEMQIPPNVVENEFENMLIEEFDGDRSKLLEYLRSENKTIAEFRNEILEDIIVSVMRSRNRQSQAEVSPERIESFYNENKIRFYQEESIHLRQIVLKPLADESSQLLLQNAQKIVEELNKGVAFEDLAREYSQDSMAKRGGDYGWLQRDELVPRLQEEALALEKGEFSEPFIFNSWVYILYCENKREEGIQPLPEVRDTIERFIISEISRENQTRWLERLRADGYVKFYL
jgi:peptidyl-prolyl cis-trans isomerase SurA